MIRVGAVNIDTSHPMGFAESMAKDGRMRYVGVYNDSFRSDAEVEGFVARFGLEKRCDTIEELARMSDIGFIQGCDWDDHLRCAEPFLRLGKPVFLDKPAVGCLADCRALEKLAGEGAVILGSSSARYAYELQALTAKPLEERGEIISVLGTSGVDEFNYGIHIVEAIGGLMGQGAQSVRYMGRGDCGGQHTESFFIRYENGKSAIYTTLLGTWQPFGMLVVTSKTTYAIQMDPMRLYDALIEQLANRLEGKPSLAADVGALTESVKIMLAGLASREGAGREVRLDALTEDGPSFDGRAFQKQYGAASGPMYALEAK